MLLHTIGLLLQAAFRSSVYHQFGLFNNAHLGPYCPLHVEYIWIKIPQKMWSKDWKNDLVWASKDSNLKWKFEIIKINFTFLILPKIKNIFEDIKYNLTQNSHFMLYSAICRYSKSVFKTLEISWVKRNVIDVPFRPISFMGH